MYGAGLGRSIELREPPSVERFPLGELIGETRTLYVRQAEGALDGRKVIFGLALLDVALREQLEGAGFLAALAGEIDLHADLSARGKALYMPDAVPTLSDQPSEVDRLGRKVFAEVIGVRLQDEYDRQAESFMLHLEGPWGSGKTSVLNFLRQDLEGTRRWVVVDFNAWQRQRVGAPWWLLMDAIYRQAVRSKNVTPWHKLKVRLDAVLWKAGLAKVWVLALLAGLALLVVLIIFGDLFTDGGDSNEVAKLVGTAGSIISAVAGFVGLVRSFPGGTARGAETFVQQTRDPMATFQRRFKRLIGTIGQPVAVFIDDLDRCRAQYVVDVLEGIQTLLREAPVTFIVAADRHWLYDSYKQVYENYGGDDPGRPLGHLFLEKTFQLSTSLPGLAAEERDEYWHSLLFPTEDEVDIKELEAKIEQEFADAHSEPEVMDRLETSSDAPRLEQRLRREAAVRRLAAPELQRQTEHTLSKFATLLEPNPRAMKRLVNAYGVERAVQILEGNSSDIDRPREKLALWTILRSRWPLLAEFLSDHPNLIEQLKQGVVPAEAEEDTQRPYLAHLFRAPEVKRVVDGEPLDGVALDETAVALFVQGGGGTSTVQEPARSEDD